MAQQLIDIGTVIGDGLGEPLRDGLNKVNENFTELYSGGGGGMTGEFSTCIPSILGGDYEIDKIESDKVKIVIGAGVAYGCYRLGSRGSTIKKGTQKLIWVNLVSDSSTIHFYGSALGAEGIFLAGNEGSMDLVYSGFHNHNLMFLAVNLGVNQWIITPYGLGNVDEMIQNSLGDYVEKVTGKSLVADTEIAKIHAQNTDTKLQFELNNTTNDLTAFYIDEKLTALDNAAHAQNTDTVLNGGGINEVSVEELRGVVDFANIATPPTAYQIPFVQDVTGVKSLKYSADFVFENGTLKVKGAGNTTGKTLSIFNLAGDEKFTILDSGLATFTNRVYQSGLGGSTFFGFEAGFSDDLTDNYNTFFGYYAGRLNTSGYFNSSFGFNAGRKNTTGYQNIYFGYAAGENTTTGGNNVFCGAESGFGNVSGLQNVFIGYQAGRFISNGSTARTTGNNGVYLGYNSKSKEIGTDNEIVIGYNAIGNGSNTATWGNTSITNHFFKGKLNVNHATGQFLTAYYDGSTTSKADFTLDANGKLTIAAAGGHEFTGDVNLTGVLKIDGVQVLKEQQAAIADHVLTFTRNPLTATTAATISSGDAPTVEEVAQVCTNLDLAIQKIATVLRTHGLIAT